MNTPIQTIVALIGAATILLCLAFALRRNAYDPLKRMVDITLSTMAMFVLSPIILAAAGAIKLDSKGPVFYAADRVGAGGRRIRVWKLRTMFLDADRHGEITSGNDPRVTRVGRFLRATKVDELPQLFNIIFGTMSIVGPRPESAKIVERYYTSEDVEVFECRPGLTCPGTLYYYIHDEDHTPRSGLTVEESYAQVSLRAKLSGDLHYIRHRRLTYDIKLIVLTLLHLSSKLLGLKLGWRLGVGAPATGDVRRREGLQADESVVSSDGR